MLSLLAATLIVPPVREPMLAFTARIYYPVGDPRKSGYQLYVSDLYGGRRRQLTAGSGGVMSVMWLSSDSLAWVDEKTDHVFVSKLQPFKPRRIALPNNAEIRNWRLQPGMPRDLIKVDEQRLTVRGLQPFSFAKLASVPRPAALGEDREYWELGGNRKLTIIREGETWRLEIAAKQYSFETEATQLFPITVEDHRLFFLARSYAGLHGRADTAYCLELGRGALVKLVDSLGKLDFQPESPYYAGLSDGGDGLAPHGSKKQVSAAKLYAGNWKTKKRWLVLGGLVHVTSVAVQPE